MLTNDVVIGEDLRACTIAHTLSEVKVDLFISLGESGCTGDETEILGTRLKRKLINLSLAAIQRRSQNQMLLRENYDTGCDVRCYNRRQKFTTAIALRYLQ